MADAQRHALSEENFPPYAFAFYCVAIDEAANLAVRSFMEFSEAVADGDFSEETAGLLHQAINHCAAISRFLWPAKRGVAAFRGARLREIYQLEIESPLNNRSLRNHLEHLDEKIDDWLSENPVGPIVPGPIFASHTIIDDGFGHAFKVIDVNDEIYVVMGKKFEFARLSVAVAELCLKADPI